MKSSALYTPTWRRRLQGKREGGQRWREKTHTHTHIHTHTHRDQSTHTCHTHTHTHTHTPVEAQCYLRLVVVEVVCSNAGNGLHTRTVILQQLPVVADCCVQIIQTLCVCVCVCMCVCVCVCLCACVSYLMYAGNGDQ